jgi:CRISPR/Cas system Type II protein with McrA/HNH and RuvC-like nuclease domain
VYLVTNTNKNKSGDDDIEKRLSRNKDQDSFGVLGQPNMALTNKKLKRQQQNEVLNHSDLLPGCCSDLWDWMRVRPKCFRTQDFSL